MHSKVRINQIDRTTIWIKSHFASLPDQILLNLVNEFKVIRYKIINNMKWQCIPDGRSNAAKCPSTDVSSCRMIIKTSVISR